jgi:hypothetical protein
MKKLALLIFLPLLILAGFLLKSHSAYAFNANDLIGDGVFDNVNSMSASAIDSWLNTYFPNSCISTNNGFSAPDPTGYSPNPSQFFYSSTAVSAGTVIYDAAQAYGINPQVLLATLQKEESLIDGGAGCATWQYASAVGYGCTDSGTNTHNYSYPGGGLVTPLYYINGSPVNSISGSCVNSGPKAGFSEQVIHAAWLLEFSRHKSEGDTGWAIIKGNWNNCDDNNTCPASWNIPASDACYSGFMTQGTFKRCPTDTSAIYYDGYATIDGSSVHMDNGATASLYVYTPHFSGNQSFDNLFTSWFGPLDVQYSWSIQSLTYSTGTNSFGNGVAGTVTLKATNNSTVPWYNYGNTPVRLGTWTPGRVSPLYSPGWLSNTRPANMTESQVDPGGTATFTFPVNVNNLGTYVEALNLVVENSQWMPWTGLSPTINIKPAYQWQVSSVSYGAGTGLMVPGTTQQITVVAENIGFTTWSNSSGPPIRLGTWQPGRQSSVAYNWLSSIRATQLSESSVAPGQTGTFQFSVRVPSTGIFYERMNLVAEGQAWFNDAGLTLYLEGGTYSWKPLWSSYSTGSNANLPRGTSMTVTVKVQNTGNIPWTNTSSNSYPWEVRFATDNPENRGSFLYDPSWISDIRPAALQESIVQPGQQGTFVFKANIPNNAILGEHYEYFSLVAEGIAWFNHPGFYLYVNVTP